MEQKSKILFYTDTPLFGGAEKQMLLLAEELKNNYLIKIVCLNNENTQNLQIEASRIDIPLITLNSKHKNSPAIFSELSKIIKTEKPDLIHAHNWNPMANKHLFLLAFFQKLKIVATEHDPFKLGTLKSIYKKLTFKKIQQFICVSESNNQLMISLYPQIKNKIQTVYNGIKITEQKFSPENRITIRKKYFNISSEKTKIIFSAGTLHSRKGFKYLILAFQKISNFFPNTVLTIAGEGPEREKLQTLINNLNLQKKIKLLGFCNNVSDLMHSADIFVLPSLKEAFGLVILEAFRAKLPVIASNSGGIPEIIQHQHNGLLSKPQNKDNLFKNLKKLLEDSQLQKKLIANSQITLSQFSSKKMAQNTAKIYQKLINTN